MERNEYMRQYRAMKKAQNSKNAFSEAAVANTKAKTGPRRKKAPDGGYERAIQTMGQDRRDEILKRINKSQSHER